VLFPNVGHTDGDMLKAVSEVVQRIAGLGGAAEHESLLLRSSFFYWLTFLMPYAVS
jgi:hypothetical protein